MTNNTSHTSYPVTNSGGATATTPADPMKLHAQQLFIQLLEIQKAVYLLINANLWITLKRSPEFIVLK